MKLATILSVLPLAFALPHNGNAKRSNDAFTVISARSASPVHLLPMNAAGTYFYLGGKPSTYCPESVSQVAPCPSGSVTAFAGNGAALVCSSISNPPSPLPPGSQGNTREAKLTVNQDVTVPGGQAIYVDSNGALRFTQPHSASIGEGSSTGPFQYTPGSSSGNGLGQYAYKGQGASGFVACPTDDNKYQVFAGLANITAPQGDAGECLGFNALTSVYRGNGTAAWEYI